MWSQTPVVTFGAIEVGGADYCGADPTLCDGILDTVTVAAKTSL